MMEDDEWYLKNEKLNWVNEFPSLSCWLKWQDFKAVFAAGCSMIMKTTSKKENHVSLKCFDEQKMIFVVNYIFF